MASANKKREAPKFLTGWKAIAAYLGNGVRTVQRYEREMGLPVRRPAGKSRAAVIATKAELDAWVEASPIRQTFHLTGPTVDTSTFRRNIADGIAEMRRLSGQMLELRNELRGSVAVLRKTIENVRNEANTSVRTKSFSIADFDFRNKAVFDLVGTRIGKAN